MRIQMLILGIKRLRETTSIATLNFFDPVAAYSSAGASKHFHSFTLVLVCLSIFLSFFLFFFLNTSEISALANRSCNRLKHFVVKHWRSANEQQVRRFMKRIEVSLKLHRRHPAFPLGVLWCTGRIFESFAVVILSVRNLLLLTVELP